MKVRSRDVCEAVVFDPERQLPLPAGAIEILRDGKPEWWWRNSDCHMDRIRPGEVLVTSRQHGHTLKYDPEAFAALYEEIPDAGEGGSQVHPDPVA